MKYITSFFLVIIASISFSQFGFPGGDLNNQEEIKDPTIWSYSFSNTTVPSGTVVTLFFDVKIQDSWTLYTTKAYEVGPLPTTFKFSPHSSYELVGKPYSINPKTKFDEGFQLNVDIFKNKGKFAQKIRVFEKKLSIKVKAEYQTCTEMCYDFSTDLAIVQNLRLLKEVEKTEGKTTTSNKSDPYLKTCNYDSIQHSLEEIKNEIKSLKFSGKSKTMPLGSNTGSIERRAGFADIVVERFGSTKREVQDNISDLLLFMGIAFLSGLLALLTPCVFPLIPMTVSFFTKDVHGNHKGFKNALLYGAFIIFIFTLVGVVFSKLFGDQIGDIIAVHWLPNLLFFVIFIIFALSFLGSFEITLPSSIINSIDAKSDKKGWIGVFFMALTLVLVTFSCTGPIVSSILIESAGGSWLKPIAGMFGFSLALALPFTLFAAFPSLLNGLPQSGGWLNSVKVVLGFVELALAFKFLSQIDLVYGFNLLDRDIFIIIWMIIFSMIGFYLLGKIKLPHDSSNEAISVSRLLMSLSAFAFVLYLAIGLIGAPLKILSGVLPPMYTQEFNLLAKESDENYICEKPLYDSEFHTPHGLQGFYDLRQAINCAIEQNKPIFLDYTGKGCSNCRMFENNIWSEEKNLALMKEKYVLLALYGDTDIPLISGESFFHDGEEIKSLKEANPLFMKEKFNETGKPSYFVLAYDKEKSSEDKTILKELQPRTNFEEGYNIEAFNKFLKGGLKEYQKMRR